MINIINNHFKFKEKYLSLHIKPKIDPKNINKVLKKRTKNFCSFTNNLTVFSKRNPGILFKGLPFLLKGFNVIETENILKLSPLSRKGLAYLNEMGKTLDKTNNSFLYPQKKFKKQSKPKTTFSPPFLATPPDSVRLGSSQSLVRRLRVAAFESDILHPSGRLERRRVSTLPALGDSRATPQPSLSLPGGFGIIRRRSTPLFTNVPLIREISGKGGPGRVLNPTGRDTRPTITNTLAPLHLPLGTGSTDSGPSRPALPREPHSRGGWPKGREGQHPSPSLALPLGGAGLKADQGKWDGLVKEGPKGTPKPRQEIRAKNKGNFSHTNLLLKNWNLSWTKKKNYFKKLSNYLLETTDFTWLNNINEIRKTIEAKYRFDLFLSSSQIVNYSFNKNYKKQGTVELKSLYKFLKSFFSSLSALISKPIYRESPEKINIRLFYFIMPTKARLIKERKLKYLIGTNSESNKYQKDNKILKKIMTKFRIKEFLARWKESENLVRLPTLPDTIYEFIESDKYYNQHAAYAPPASLSPITACYHPHSRATVGHRQNIEKTLALAHKGPGLFVTTPSGIHREAQSTITQPLSPACNSANHASMPMLDSSPFLSLNAENQPSLPKAISLTPSPFSCDSMLCFFRKAKEAKNNTARLSHCGAFESKRLNLFSVLSEKENKNQPEHSVPSSPRVFEESAPLINLGAFDSGIIGDRGGSDGGLKAYMGRPDTFESERWFSFSVFCFQGARQWEREKEKKDRAKLSNEKNFKYSEIASLTTLGKISDRSSLLNLADKEIFKNGFNSLQLLKFNKIPTFLSLNDKITHMLVSILESVFGKVVEVDIKKLKYPYHDSNMLSQILKTSSYRTTFKNMMKRILYTATINNPTNLIRKQDFSVIPSFLSGIKVRLAGRIATQRVVPRFTVQAFQMGSLARGKINLAFTSRITQKNKRGVFSFTVTTGHFIENKKIKK